MAEILRSTKIIFLISLLKMFGDYIQSLKEMIMLNLNFLRKWESNLEGRF